MSGTVMYAVDNTDSLPLPGWQMDRPSWASDANIAPLGGATPATLSAIIQAQLEHVRKGQLFPYLKSEKYLMCPFDRVDSRFYARKIYITSYIWNGGVVSYVVNLPSKKLSDPNLKATRILQWENDETKMLYGQWNDFSNYPDEGISRRHDKGVAVGLLDGSAKQMKLTDFYRLAGTYPTGNPPGGAGSGRGNTSRGNTAGFPGDLWWY
jgi:hypothetical protein